MQLGTEIGKMTRKLFTRFSKSRPWMLATGCNAARSRLRCWQRLARRTTGDQPGSAPEIRSMPRLSWLARCRLRRQDHFNHLPVTLQVGSSDLVNHPEPIRLFRC